MPETPDIPEELPSADGGAALSEAAPPLREGETPENAETAHVPETAKEHEPMLDVHPAHHAATTWREFFIHIATIVLGLLIAVGLEQAVEYIHHRREAREARENIQQEIAINLDILERNQRYLADTEQKLARNLDLLNSSAPDAQILPQLNIDWKLTRRHDAAWNAAKIDGSLALIPPSQISHANYFYESNNDITPALSGYFTEMDTAGTLIAHATAAGKLTASERQLLVSLTISAMGHGRFVSRMFANDIYALQSNELQ
jgi:hypothetical protein